MPIKEIDDLKNSFVMALAPIQVYLFGSYADGTYTDESDLDFYIVLPDGVFDLAAETTKAYKAARKTKNHPVDIIVGTKSRFESRKRALSVESEVYKKGVLLYDSGD
jgi:predicted nucleotidyltransferase